MENLLRLDGLGRSRNDASVLSSPSSAMFLALADAADGFLNALNCPPRNAVDMVSVWLRTSPLPLPLTLRLLLLVEGRVGSAERMGGGGAIRDDVVTVGDLDGCFGNGVTLEPARCVSAIPAEATVVDASGTERDGMVDDGRDENDPVEVVRLAALGLGADATIRVLDTALGPANCCRDEFAPDCD